MYLNLTSDRSSPLNSTSRDYPNVAPPLPLAVSSNPAPDLLAQGETLDGITQMLGDSGLEMMKTHGGFLS
jgi:hypothetical protein